MTENQPICHVLMAIDASGSMWRLADDVRGGFNQYVQDLAKDKDTDYRITVALFNTGVWYLCKDTSPADLTPLDDKNYQPSGGTALLDAIGELAGNFRNRDNAGDRPGDPEPAPDAGRVLVVANTDGQENSSVEWNLGGVRQLVKDREATGRWGFVFLGAGPEVWMQGSRMGIGASGQTVNTQGGTRGSYSGLTSGTRSYAAGASAQSVASAATEASAKEDEKESK